MCLVDARNRRGDTRAAGVRLTAKADVAAVVVGLGAGNAANAVTRAEVAVCTRRDELNTTKDGRLGANRRGKIGIREVDVLAHITEHRGARGGQQTQRVVIARGGIADRPGD